MPRMVSSSPVEDSAEVEGVDPPAVLAPVAAGEVALEEDVAPEEGRWSLDELDMGESSARCSPAPPPVPVPAPVPAAAAVVFDPLVAAPAPSAEGLLSAVAVVAAPSPVGAGASPVVV